ncbi:MAG: arylesterase, partial [Lachnospira sp.]|nr:arylesterase [Lachnospira sp.]
MKNILFFGDSNTYGYKPDGSGRFDRNIRWTGRISDNLGPEYNVIEEGLCGRTTIFP